MKEEKYKAKCPGHVLIADTAYLEKHGKDKKKYEVIDYQPPSGFQMGILLEQFQHPFEKACIRYAVNLYFAPEQYLDACMKQEAVTWQGVSQKWADTGNACYKVMADERQENVNTEADGIWSQYQEFYSYDGDARKTKAVRITLVVPDDETFEGMRRLMYSLFEEVRPVHSEEIGKYSGKGEMGDGGKASKSISVKGQLKELRNAKPENQVEKMLPAAVKSQKGKGCKKDPER